jgi:2-phospho-L-lactate guanylyltransferase (CobY/MobA/RfbA family)
VSGVMRTLKRRLGSVVDVESDTRVVEAENSGAIPVSLYFKTTNPGDTLASEDSPIPVRILQGEDGSTTVPVRVVSSDLVAIGYESITVAATAIGVSTTVYAPVGGRATKAFFTLETGQIRIRYDGTSPTSTEGHLVEVGQSFELDGATNIQQFRAIRTGQTSGVLKVTVER